MISDGIEPSITDLETVVLPLNYEIEKLLINNFTKVELRPHAPIQ